MRVMVIIKATKASEAGDGPSEELLTQMMKYTEELVNAGIMVGGEGLLSSALGKRVRFSGTKRTVIDGPFSESKELIAGFWLWKVKSMDEAVEWLKRCPNPDGGDSEVEIRQVAEVENFKEATPEVIAKEKELRERSTGRA